MEQVPEPKGVSSDCSEITFLNKGTSILYVDGVPFQPDTGITFGTDRVDSLDETVYQIKFSSTVVTDNMCHVIRKTYRNI